MQYLPTNTECVSHCDLVQCAGIIFTYNHVFLFLYETKRQVLQSQYIKDLKVQCAGIRGMSLQNMAQIKHKIRKFIFISV